VSVWLGNKLEVGGQWDGRLTLTFWLTEYPDDHWMDVFNVELDARQQGLRAVLSRVEAEAVLTFRDVGLESLEGTLDMIGGALEATLIRYSSDLQFTQVIGRQALGVVKDWREGLKRPE
jgi:hypothetical protein